MYNEGSAVKKVFIFFGRYKIKNPFLSNPRGTNKIRKSSRNYNKQKRNITSIPGRGPQQPRRDSVGRSFILPLISYPQLVIMVMDELIACMPMPKQILLNNEALKTELICERGAFHHYLSKLGLNADKTIWVNRILSFSLFHA